MMPLLSVARDEPQRETIQPWRIQALVAALDDPSIKVQRAAIRWLSKKDVSDQRLADKVGVLLQDNRWNKDRAEVLAALASLGKDGAKFAPQVADLLKDQDIDVRIKDQDIDVRISAFEALGRMGEAGAKFAPQVAELLKDQEFVRRSAADALREMGEAGAKVAPQVADLLNDRNTDVRSSAASVLGRMGKDGHRSRIQKCHY